MNKKHLAVYIMEILAGIILLGLGVAGKLDEFWSGMGGALIGIGTMRLVQIVCYQKNEAYRENVNTERNDERNRFLHMKAWQLTAGWFTITDDSTVTRTYTKKATTPSGTQGAWYLTKITDTVGNSVIFTFDSSLRPTKVSVKPNGLTQIDFLDLYYYSSGRLRMINNYTTKESVVFRYSDTY